MEIRSTANSLEIRLTEGDELEVRAGVGEQPSKLIGYAAVYNSLSADLGGFKERIMPGAFKGSVAGSTDIRALVDHDSTKLLGRTSNGTLRLAEDAKGLRIEIDLPDTSYARDTRNLIARKDVRGMSFGFLIPDGGQRFTKESGQTIRELTNIDLREVTVTSVPAYGDTSVQVRVDPSILAQINATENSSVPTLAKRWHQLRTMLVKG